MESWVTVTLEEDYRKIQFLTEFETWILLLEDFANCINPITYNDKH